MEARSPGLYQRCSSLGRRCNLIRLLHISFKSSSDYCVGCLDNMVDMVTLLGLNAVGVAKFLKMPYLLLNCPIQERHKWHNLDEPHTGALAQHTGHLSNATACTMGSNLIL